MKVTPKKLLKALFFTILVLSLSVITYAQETLWEELYIKADTLFKERKFHEAAEVASEALKVAETKFGPDDYRVGGALELLANIYRFQQKFAEAESYNKRALKIRKKYFGIDSFMVAISLDSLGWDYSMQRKYEDAEIALKKAIEIKEKIGRPDGYNVMVSLNLLARVYMDQGKYAEAEPLLRRSVEIAAKKGLGQDDPYRETLVNSVKECYERLGKKGEEKELLKLFSNMIIKYGYIDKTGEIVIAPRFDWAFSFSEGLAFVGIDGKAGCIDRNGEVVINPQFDWAYPFSEGLAVISIMGSTKMGFIDRTGRLVINPQFDTASSFYEGLAAIRIDGKKGYINKKGEIVIKPQFDMASRFSEGLAAIRTDDKMGFIDKKGEIVIKPQFDVTSNFSEGLVAVRIDDKMGFIDKIGEIVINPQFYMTSDFSEGLAAVRTNGTIGFIDKAGEIVINPQFEQASPFSEGLAAVIIDGKTGYIDKQGEIVIKPEFDRAYHFSEGLAAVIIDGKTGYINKQGEIVIKPEFDRAYHFSEGLAVIKTTEMAKSEDVVQQVTVTSNSLNVYSRTSTDSKVLKELKRGDTVKVVFEVSTGEGDWCGIKMARMTTILGYVLCQYLEGTTIVSSPVQDYKTLSEELSPTTKIERTVIKPIKKGKKREIRAVIKGTVTNHKGNPVKQVRITACEKIDAHSSSNCVTSVTDGYGNYSMDLFYHWENELRDGSYDFHIYPDRTLNLKSEYKKLNINEGETKIVDITLKQCGSITGKVTDARGNPVTEAWVYKIDLGKPCPCGSCCDFCMTSQRVCYMPKECELGTFTKAYLEPGDYKIGAVIKKGEEEIEIPPKLIKVDLGKTITVNFTAE